ncbi:MAG: hypothetical protein KME17_14700 [Cyanosarcina radialis HA8281-LM2]|jgi:hypothetical protein|nr:hypothetical protein [Cyanosarcina radialis HA8281-LM2]
MNAINLSDLLSIVENFSGKGYLYLPKSKAWDLNMYCAIVEDEEDKLSNQELIDARNLKYALGIGAVQDIISNASSQKDDIDLLDLLNALKFYYDNDAFIEF